MLDNLLEHRHHVFDVADFLFVNEHVGVFKDDFHAGRIGHEVRRQVAAIELHAFDPLLFGLKALAFVDGDDSVFANLAHRIGEKVADFAIVVTGDRSHIGHRFLVLDLDGHLVQFSGDVRNGGFDAALHLNRIDTSDDSLEALVENRFGHHGCGGRAVTGNIGSLRRDFADHSGAHVFVRVFQVDFLGDGHAVFGDRWATEALLQNHISALRTKCDLNGASELADATANRFAGFLIKSNDFWHWEFILVGRLNFG